MRLPWPAVCCALLLLPACVTVEERPGVSMSERSGTATAQLRSQVDEMRPGTVSVMPAGLEQQLSPEDLADLVAFLKACK